MVMMIVQQWYCYTFDLSSLCVFNCFDRNKWLRFHIHSDWLINSLDIRLTAPTRCHHIPFRRNNDVFSVVFSQSRHVAVSYINRDEPYMIDNNIVLRGQQDPFEPPTNYVPSPSASPAYYNPSPSAPPPNYDTVPSAPPLSYDPGLFEPPPSYNQVLLNLQWTIIEVLLMFHQTNRKSRGNFKSVDKIVAWSSLFTFLDIIFKL